MRLARSLVLWSCLALLPLIPAAHAFAWENLSVAQIVERAHQREKTSQELIRDYVCQATSTIREPQKDGTSKTLSIEEKTIYRKFPDQRMVKYTAVTEDGKVLTPEEVAEYQKKQGSSMSMQSNSFLGPDERANYTYELMPPDTVKGVPSYVLRFKPKKKAKNLLDGTAWLHQDNFEIIKLTFRLAKNPKFVKELNISFDFDEVQPGCWLPVELKFNVHAGFLLFKKHFHIHEVRRDYQINRGLPDSLFVEEE